MSLSSAAVETSTFRTQTNSAYPGLLQLGIMPNLSAACIRQVSGTIFNRQTNDQAFPLSAVIEVRLVRRCQVTTPELWAQAWFASPTLLLERVLDVEFTRQPSSAGWAVPFYAGDWMSLMVGMYLAPAEVTCEVFATFDIGSPRKPV